MSSGRHLSILASATIVAVCIATTPAVAGGYFGFTVADDNFALSFGIGAWAPYGSAWSDPGWSVDYRSSLASYGEWVWVDGLGSVWRPWVAADWRPYTHGRWVWTSYGWTWVAYEPWGWLPHHYGSWALAPAGWVWVPGYEYRPANVVWVTSGHHVGWYPCGPPGWSHHSRGFRHGYNHGYHDGRHDGYRQGHRDGYRSGYDDGWRDALEATWVDRRHLGADDLSRHAVNHDRLSRSGIVAKPAILEGAPSRSEVDRHAERRIPEARISTRTIEMAGRQAVAVRPEGLERDVTDHSVSTVRTALSPTVARRVEHQLETSRTMHGRGGEADRRTVEPAHRSPTVSSGTPTSRTMHGRDGVADRRTVEPEHRSPTVSSYSPASRAPTSLQRPAARDARSVEPRGSTAPRVSPSSARPQVRSSNAERRPQVRQMPSTPATTPATGSEMGRRRPMAPPAAVRSTTQIDGRRAPTVHDGARDTPMPRPESARRATRTSPEIKPDSRRTAPTPRTKPETPRAPATSKARSRSGGSS